MFSSILFIKSKAFSPWPETKDATAIKIFHYFIIFHFGLIFMPFLCCLNFLIWFYVGITVSFFFFKANGIQPWPG